MEAYSLSVLNDAIDAMTACEGCKYYTGKSENYCQGTDKSECQRWLKKEEEARKSAKRKFRLWKK